MLAACSSSSSSSSSSSGPFESDDTNVTILTAYNPDGNVSSITAVNGVTGKAAGFQVMVAHQHRCVMVERQRL